MTRKVQHLISSTSWFLQRLYRQVVQHLNHFFFWGGEYNRQPDAVDNRNPLDYKWPNLNTLKQCFSFSLIQATDCEFKFWCGIEVLKNLKNGSQILHTLQVRIIWIELLWNSMVITVPFINYFWTLIQFLWLFNVWSCGNTCIRTLPNVH